jgi:hypothetical protein
VLEAGFLILLAVVVGLADLSAALIVLVMAVGWLLVSLIEYSAWRQTAGLALVRRSVTVEEASAAPVHEEVIEDVAPPPPPAPPPPEEETIVAPPEAEPVAPAEAEPVRPPQDAPPAAGAEERIAFHQPQRETAAYRLEPLQPRPSRRWIIFGPRVRPEGDREEEG